jgi:hypothetical protein
MSRLEKTAAAAMAVSFLLLAGAATRSFVLSRRPDPATVPLVKIGEAVKLPGVSPGTARLTFVIVMSSGCTYCLHDLPLYRRLSAARSASGGMLHLVAVLPEKASTAAEFLRSSGVATDNLLSLAPLDVGARMVPTLLLLDENGKLRRYWVGEMGQEREREVLEALTASCSSCRLSATNMQ